MLLADYFRLGASLLSFNVDEGFGQCIDGLIIVDLRATDRNSAPLHGQRRVPTLTQVSRARRPPAASPDGARRIGLSRRLALMTADRARWRSLHRAR